MKKIAIIGAGLSGLTMAYCIKEKCEADVTIFEKGKKYVDRIETDGKDLLSGEGGAGTLFGGKLCFPPASSGVWKRSGLDRDRFGNYKRECLEQFILREDIRENVLMPQLYLKNKELFIKDYTSILLNKTEMQTFVSGMLRAVKEKGAIISNNSEFVDYRKKDDRLTVKCICEGIETVEDFDYLVFASGRLSADSTVKWLNDRGGVTLQNPDLGIRFSMKRKESGIFHTVGKDIKVKAKFGEIGVRTFCVCSGGSKTFVDLKGMKYYDGHFEDEISDEVNMGILARSPYIFGYEGAALFCSCLKKYIGSDFSLKDFVRYSDRLIKDNDIFSDILNSINRFVNLMKKQHMIDDNLDKYPVWFPSVDRLNPIVKTNCHFETDKKNIYVIGDAIGISRGFVQSMWSAYCASEQIVAEIKGQKCMEKMIV